MFRKIAFKARRWEGIAFTGAYVFALAVALWVLLSSKHETRSLLAWLVFGVFALCMTGIFVLYRQAAKAEAKNGDWPGRTPGNDTSQYDR
jgi:hypothetical protein